MGRWSRKLAPLFIDFAGVSDGEKILDVGCGTGSLTVALASTADLEEIAAIDYSPVPANADNHGRRCNPLPLTAIAMLPGNPGTILRCHASAGGPSSASSVGGALPST